MSRSIGCNYQCATGCPVLVLVLVYPATFFSSWTSSSYTWVWASTVASSAFRGMQCSLKLSLAKAVLALSYDSKVVCFTSILVAEPCHPTILTRRARGAESSPASTKSSWPCQIELKIEPKLNKDFLISSKFNCGTPKICPKLKKYFLAFKRG